MARILTAKNEKHAIDEAVASLLLGNSVVIPTETVYGLAADASNGKAVANIFELKGRPKFNPLICHVDGIEMAKKYGVFSEVAEKLALKFWPGPLTLVVPLCKNANIHDLVSADLDTIGLRCPQGIGGKIISELGKPLAAPSANKSGKLSPTRAEHVAEAFVDEDLLIIDEGACEIGLESTIVKVEEDKMTLLRPGGISKEEIENLTGAKLLEPLNKDQIQAPGMMASHYAPDASVKLNCTSTNCESAYLAFGDPPENIKGPLLNLSRNKNMAEAAANLYQYLKELDASGVHQICVSPIPHIGLGIAINDRLKRAAAPRQ